MSFISVIIPLYNKEKYVERTLNSVLSQTYDDYEIVVVDDGSTDNSLNIITQMSQKCNTEKIRLIKKQNGGPSSARNRGVIEAKGEWIVFLDADDLLIPYALDYFYNLIRNNRPDIKYFICNYFEKKGELLHLYSKSKRKGIVKNKYFLEAARDLTERPGSAIIKKELLINHPFNEKLRRFEDAECQYNLMRHNDIYVSSVPVMITDRDATVAARARDNVSEDFIGNLVFEGKSFWEQMCLYVLALSGSVAYPYIKETYRVIFSRIDYRIAFYYMRVWSIIIYFFRDLFYKDDIYTLDDLVNRKEPIIR